MKTEHLPVGYWIKLTDELLTEGINSIQASLGLSRTGWQVLNAIRENNSMEKMALQVLMQPLATPDKVADVLVMFRDEGWLNDDGHLLTLTNAGKAMHKKAAEQQQSFRQQAMAGISEAEYRTTVQTLQRIVTNIGAR